MLREIRLLGKGTDITGWTGSIDPGTSPYPWSNTPSKSLSQVWNNLSGGSNPYERDAAYNWGAYGTEHAMEFEPGPTLATFTKLRFVWGMDYSQEGPNNWWFPPDNAAGPTVGLLVRNRAQSGFLSIYSYTFTTPGDDAHNTNTNTEFPTVKEFEHEITGHPEGGPWTLNDINHIAAGLSFSTTNGPNGKWADDPIRFTKFRAFYFALYVTVQDLGGYTRSVRHNASATLRMKRKARNAITFPVPAHETVHELGEVENIAHARGADSGGEGWGPRALDRRNGWLVQRTYWPEALKVVDEYYDLHDFSCEAWGAFRIPLAWTPELNGLAYLDQGGEFDLARAQDAWSLRPGDGAALRVLEDYPNLSEDGLAIHEAGGEELMLWNANLGEAEWASATTGGASFSASTTQPMADELGFLDSVVLTFGGSPGTASKSQEFEPTAGDIVNVRVRVRNITNDDPDTKFLEAVLEDDSGNFWNDATRSWDASPVYNPIPAAGSGFGEVIFDQVPIVNTETHTLRLGRFSSSINTAVFIIGLANLTLGEEGAGMPLVAGASTVTRVADVWEMDNSGDFTFWHRALGGAIVDFRPFWRAEELADATEKKIVRADHTGGAFDEVRFVAGTTVDKIVFERSDGGGSQTVEVEIRDDADAVLRLTRDYYVRVYARWLGEDGWRQHAPYEALLGVAIFNLDHTFVAYHEQVASWVAPDAETEDVVQFAGLHGWIRWFEVKRKPLTGTEATWRR